MMFCPKCGYNYGDADSNFCPKCGAPLSVNSAGNNQSSGSPSLFRDETNNQTPGSRLKDSRHSQNYPAYYKQARRKIPSGMIVVGVAIGLYAFFSIIGALSDGSEYSPGMTYSKKVEYIETTVDKLYDDLDSNSMRAKETWDGQYIKVVGRLNSIDSDGAYLTIAPSDSGFSFNNLQCSIPDALQDQVKNLNIDDIVLVQAQIDMVGDILGYHADLIWIQAAE